MNPERFEPMSPEGCEHVNPEGFDPPAFFQVKGPHPVLLAWYRGTGPSNKDPLPRSPPISVGYIGSLAPQPHYKWRLAGGYIGSLAGQTRLRSFSSSRSYASPSEA